MKLIKKYEIMKKVLLSLIGMIACISLFAQTPNQFKYQAVLRNADGTIMAEENVDIIISILKSDLTTSVFNETHSITTTSQGLVNLSIGSIEDLSTVDFSADTYFVEINVNGTVMGTSQLLSVPYALYAKTADSISDGITETDPVFGAWDKDYADLINAPTTITTAQANAITENTAKDTYPAADETKLAGIEEGAEVNVQADWNQATTTADDYIKNKPTIPAEADGSETKVTEGTNVTVTGSGTTASPYVVNATGGASLAIGDSYQGGIIFWLDATGQHGLIAATADQSTGIQWYNGTFRHTGTTGDGLYAGAMNTAMIIATQMADNQTGNFAAKVCANYSVTESGVTYGDWYLPSKYELNLLHAQKAAVGGFASAYYWSSNEINSLNGDGNAWGQSFDTGSQNYGSKSNTLYVRAVRAF